MSMPGEKYFFQDDEFDSFTPTATEIEGMRDEINELTKDLEEARDKLQEVASLIDSFLEDANPVDRRELVKFCRGFKV